jgi:hypothetical protein
VSERPTELESVEGRPPGPGTVLAKYRWDKATPEQRRVQGQAMQRGIHESFERLVDPNRELHADVRAALAVQARRDHLARISRKGVIARRAAKAAKEAAEQRLQETCSHVWPADLGKNAQCTECAIPYADYTDSPDGAQ